MRSMEVMRRDEQRVDQAVVHVSVQAIPVDAAAHEHLERARVDERISDRLLGRGEAFEARLQASAQEAEGAEASVLGELQALPDLGKLVDVVVFLVRVGGEVRRVDRAHRSAREDLEVRRRIARLGEDLDDPGEHSHLVRPSHAATRQHQAGLGRAFRVCHSYQFSDIRRILRMFHAASGARVYSISAHRHVSSSRSSRRRRDRHGAPAFSQ